MRPLRILAVACCLLGAPLFGGDKPPDFSPKLLPPAPVDLPPELQPLVIEGKKQFDRGDYAEAEKTFRAILEKVPHNVFALTNLGVALFRESKLKEAEEIFKQAVATAPMDGFSHCTLGIVYYTQGKYDEAVNELTTALEIDPKNATAHNYLGITASQKGWQEAAEKELVTATALDPNYADAHFNLAVIYATRAPPNVEHGRKYYGLALKLGAGRDAALEGLLGWNNRGAAPSDPGAPPQAKPAEPGSALHVLPELFPLAREGKEQIDRGNYLEAEKVYRKMLEKDPNNLYALSNLGVVLLRERKNGLAEKTLKQAIAVAPGDGFAHCTLGIVYYNQGKYDDAVNELTKALAIDPKNALAHNYLGATFNQKGWQEKAQKELEKAKELDPSYYESAAPKGGGSFRPPSENEKLLEIPPGVGT